MIEVTYLTYLVISIAMTVWVARTLSTNGLVYLVDGLGGNQALAVSTNHLLTVGFYLLNIGYIALTLKERVKPTDMASAMELLVSKLGWVLLFLGAMHFFTMIVISSMRRRALQHCAYEENAKV